MGFDPKPTTHYLLPMNVVRVIAVVLVAIGSIPMAHLAFAQQQGERESLFEAMRNDKDRGRLGSLYDELAAAADEEAAKEISGRIWKIWLSSGSDTVDILIQRANAAMEAKDTETAEKLLDATVEIAPNFAEGWNRRATLHFAKKQFRQSMADVQRVLAIEPRHFGALNGLAAMLQEAGQESAALDVYRKALKVHPFLPGVRRAVETLEAEVEGREI